MGLAVGACCTPRRPRIRAAGPVRPRAVTDGHTPSLRTHLISVPLAAYFTLLTMSLPMLVNGAECGPSNPLQGLSKRFDQDRGIQQVRTSQCTPSDMFSRDIVLVGSIRRGEGGFF